MDHRLVEIHETKNKTHEKTVSLSHWQQEVHLPENLDIGSH